MPTVTAKITPDKIPGYDHHSESADGVTVYGAAKDGMHRVIAVIKNMPNGDQLIDAESIITSNLGVSATPVTSEQALTKYPIHETVLEVLTPGRKPSTAVHIGPPPTGDTMHGRKVISTKPAVGWTLEKMRKMNYEIAAPVEPEEEPAPKADAEIASLERPE